MFVVVVVVFFAQVGVSSTKLYSAIPQPKNYNDRDEGIGTATERLDFEICFEVARCCSVPGNGQVDALLFLVDEHCNIVAVKLTRQLR